jgi:hypothetical protein
MANANAFLSKNDFIFMFVRFIASSPFALSPYRPIASSPIAYIQ